jgi:ferric-dicitrate binding protein FerR (iron transport regulator)
MKTDEKILWQTSQYEIPKAIPMEEAFKRVMNKIADVDKTKPYRITRMPVRYFAAAAAILALLIGSWFAWNYVTVENVVAEKGHQSDCRLPDGSKVSLNADTRIMFNRSNFNKKRSLKMDGEAFFNIEKGNTFIISTELADIRILGTSFNVYARENAFKVSCFTGKILVTSGSQSVIVTPNESARVENDKLTVTQEENIHESAGWRIGEFDYVNKSLNLVFDEIERQYNVTFVLPDIEEKYFTGTITNKNLVDALDIVCIPMGLTYEIGSNSKILVKYKTD